jgi:hypothetical protein
MIKTKTTEQVEYFLRKWAKLRDDDNKLIATIWKWQIEDVYKLDYKSMSAHQLLQMVAEHKLASSESIRRGRCKLQELKPALRGAKYNERQKQAQVVKKEMIDWGKSEPNPNQLSMEEIKATQVEKHCTCSSPNVLEYMGTTACQDCGLVII